MSANQFTISSGWEPRRETPETLGERTLKNLDALTNISPYFAHWWFNDLRISAEEMVEKELELSEIKKIFFESRLPLEKVRNRMVDVVNYGVRRNDFRNPEPGGGYSIIASTDDSNPSLCVTLSAHGGGVVDPRAGLRFANFQTDYNNSADPAIVSYPVFRAALMSIVSAWDVGDAQAYSAELCDLWDEPSKSFDLAWMTYLSPKLASKVVPPNDVVVERYSNGGLLLVAAEETFDTANPKHMAAARSILASLAELNAEMEAEAKRLWPSR